MNTHNRMWPATATATAEQLALRKSILDQTEASLLLSKHVIDARARKSNFVFSPLSIHVLLGLIASGSSGPTRDQILDFVKSKSLDDLHALFSECVSRVLADGSLVGGPVLSTANGLWVDGRVTLKPGYRNTVVNVYKAVSEHVDFKNKSGKVIEEVNAWAERETRGVISDVVSKESVDSFTRFILANALYFKGAWRESFDKTSTEEREFYLLNGSSVRAAMMSSWKDQYVSFFDGFKVLRLPYEQGGDTRRSFAMYVYLPDARDGLAALTERVCSEPGFIDGHLPLYQERLHEFWLPKFEISFELKQASDLLQELGLVLPFGGDGDGGGLTEMVAGRDPLYVSGMFHKAFIEVNEEGTVAAAVTVMAGGYGCSWQRKRLEFVADHPFLFLIREETTGLLLFIGHLLNPVSGN